MTHDRRLALSFCFLAGGLGIGTWGANLPALGRRASLSEGEIGFVLLLFAAGAVIAMNKGPRIIHEFGAGRLAAIAAVLFGFCIMLVGLPVNLVSAIFVAILMGICFGTLDVTMNNEAVTLEQIAGRPIMSSLHAIFSLGTLVSAIVYAALVRSEISESRCVLGAGVAVLLFGVAGWSGLRHVRKVPSSSFHITGRAIKERLPKRPVLMLGGLAFLAFFVEGAILDWIAIFVVRVVGVSESAGALSYGVFAGAMTLGRFFGDYAKRRFGANFLFRYGSLLVLAGFTTILMFPWLPVLLIAIFFCGIGIANLIPLIFSGAGHSRESDGGRGMSQVMTMGYAGILIGPAIIGFLAEALTLLASLWIVVAALVIVLLGSRLLNG